MIADPERLHGDRDAQLAAILQASRDAVREALRRHMLLGESVAVADETGKGVKMLGPEEIRKLLEST